MGSMHADNFNRFQVSGFGCQDGGTRELNPDTRMKPRQNGTVFGIIKLVTLAAGLKSEPQNFEGWNRRALSFYLIKIDRMPSFDIRYSLFDIRFLILI